MCPPMHEYIVAHAWQATIRVTHMAALSNREMRDQTDANHLYSALLATCFLAILCLTFSTFTTIWSKFYYKQMGMA